MSTYFYNNIFKNGLKETREETMNCIDDKYIKKIFEDEKIIKYICKTKYNEITNYILFKNPYQLQFDLYNKNKIIYIVLHYINDIETIYSMNNLKEIRKFTIDTIKNNNHQKLFNINDNFNTEYNVIHKLNDMYIFEKKENNKDIKKLYISPYLETLELKWIPIEFIFNNDINNTNRNRLYDNKEVYNTIFYKDWNNLYKKIMNKKIDEYWLSNYLEGKNINNEIIINYHYQNLIISFLKNNIQYF